MSSIMATQLTPDDLKVKTKRYFRHTSHAQSRSSEKEKSLNMVQHQPTLTVDHRETEQFQLIVILESNALATLVSHN